MGILGKVVQLNQVDIWFIYYHISSQPSESIRRKNKYYGETYNRLKNSHPMKSGLNPCNLKILPDKEKGSFQM